MQVLAKPLYGSWGDLEDLPDAFELDGRVYHRARYRQRYSGVVEQYREAVPRQSAHLLVLADGNWIVEHVDDWNPDMGHQVKHFLLDHPVGRGLVATGAGLGMLAIAVKRGMTERDRKDGKTYIR